MTPAAVDLPRRAVACPRWRWLPGMRVIDSHGGLRVVVVHPERMWLTEEDWEGSTFTEDAGRWGALGDPDLDDPATLGCLLALVREAWGAAAHFVRLQTHDYDGQGGTKSACWWALALGLQSAPFMIDGHRYLAGPTEAEALVAALEAAP